jgi:outer membrane protein assembly factor BamB
MAFVVLAALLSPSAALAQIAPRPAALPAADMEQLDAASAAYLENARRFLAERQWSEAVEAIRRVQEGEPTRLVKVELGRPVSGFTKGFERYVPAAEYCQWRLAALATEAPEALEHYRRLVDGLAQSWLQAGEKANDERLLEQVVEQAFASHFGDDALLKLGDLALSRGDAATARGYWQRISPKLASSPPAASSADKESYPSPTTGLYPDTELDLAAIQARLALASILEGSRERSAGELAAMKELYPAAEGELGGRRGRYVDLLPELFKESADWPPPKKSPDWPTFGGNPEREKIAAGGFELSAKPLWTYALPRLTAERELFGQGRLRAADDSRGLLCYEPIVVGDKVFLRLDARGNSYVVSLNLKTGQRLWQVDFSRGLTSRRADETNDPLDNPLDQPPAASDAHRDLGRYLGVARYTLTASDGKLFARLGSPITVPTNRRGALWLAKDQGFLMGFDLATQGKPLEGFPIRPPSKEWSFEGTPLCSAGAIYVVMRRVEGSRSQFYLAAFELQTTPSGQPDDRGDDARPTGRLKWRTRICSSTTAGAGEIDELTHLLLTESGGRLYVNTNAGAVAAVHADDGRLLWLVKYPRTGLRTDHPDQPEQHLFRDLTPCLAWKDLVIVAPADCDRIFALAAMSGELVWSLPPGEADDAVHLLGVADDTLIASGDYLYWIDAYAGRLMTQFPRGKLGGAEQSAPAPRGYGRGLIAGDQVCWPTRESLLVFDARPVLSDFGYQPRLEREISLLERGATGGNLVMAGGVLLIAGADKLVAFGTEGSGFRVQK